MFAMLMSCSRIEPQVPYNKIEPSKENECLMEMNKEFALIEDSLIQTYIDTSRFSFTTTNTGLRYSIVSKGNGTKAAMGDEITYKYSVRQLTGESCEKMLDQTRTVSLGKNDLERGFREALQLLEVSSTGVFLMPSFLAYGVIGVPKCIPSWTPVVCTITLIDVGK